MRHYPVYRLTVTEPGVQRVEVFGGVGNTATNLLGKLVLYGLRTPPRTNSTRP